MKTDLYTKEGKKSSKQIDLNPAIFEVEPNEDLIAQYIRVHSTNQRLGTAKTKTRAEVSGGGRKPWRQKGTGRARHGSIRSPLWAGGGSAFGPRPKDWSLKISKKMRKLALFSALSKRTKEGKIIILEDLLLDKISAKAASDFIEKLPIDGKALIVLPKVDDKIIKSFNNLSKITTHQASNLNAFEVIGVNTLVILKESLKVLEKTYLGS